ncbi:MAG: hypothetical protein CMO24_01545 [Thiotrichales bacterium]|nr:hypothetical protein [Thiotrichales bacterium]
MYKNQGWRTITKYLIVSTVFIEKIRHSLLVVYSKVTQKPVRLKLVKIHVIGAHFFLSLPADLSNKKYKVLNATCQAIEISN